MSGARESSPTVHGGAVDDMWCVFVSPVATSEQPLSVASAKTIQIQIFNAAFFLESNQPDEAVVLLAHPLCHGWLHQILAGDVPHRRGREGADAAGGHAH